MRLAHDPVPETSEGIGPLAAVHSNKAEEPAEFRPDLFCNLENEHQQDMMSNQYMFHFWRAVTDLSSSQPHLLAAAANSAT